LIDFAKTMRSVPSTVYEYVSLYVHEFLIYGAILRLAAWFGT